MTLFSFLMTATMIILERNVGWLSSGVGEIDVSRKPVAPVGLGDVSNYSKYLFYILFILFGKTRGLIFWPRFLISSPTLSLFLPRFLVLNNRNPYFFLVFGYLLISSIPPPAPRGVAIGQNIYPCKIRIAF